MAQPPNPFNQQQAIDGVKHIIAVSSGKGGVGKSTVAVNLALALSKEHKVGLLDADIYGPSVPRMMGALNQKPVISKDQKITPIMRYGIQIMSIGFLVNEESAIVWRGPMLFKAIDQFLRDVQWGELDYLVVDLPPGTGDVQLSLVQKVPLAGAVVVSTPQNLALIDVKRAIDMFKRVDVPILGMVENMSYFMAEGSTEKQVLFPKGEIESYLKANDLDKLGEVGFHPSVALASESGIPIVESNPKHSESLAFMAIAQAILEKVHD